MTEFTYSDCIANINRQDLCLDVCKTFVPTFIRADRANETITFTDEKGRDHMITLAQSGFATFEEFEADTKDKFTACNATILPVVEEICTCTPVFYESTPGEIVDNAVLLAASSAATFPDGSIGGATGVSHVQGNLIPKGSNTKDGTTAKQSQIISNNLNGNQIGFDPMEGVNFGDATKFEDVPPFSIEPSSQSITQWTYTVYKCA